MNHNDYKNIYPNLAIWSFMGGETEGYPVKYNAPTKGAFVTYVKAPQRGPEPRTWRFKAQFQLRGDFENLAERLHISRCRQLHARANWPTVTVSHPPHKTIEYGDNYRRCNSHREDLSTPTSTITRREY